MAGVFATAANAQELNTADVDLKRYAGRWYEIAKYPNKFQRVCKANTTANYTLKNDGKIEVVNECLEADGSTNRAGGEAKVPDQ